MQGHVMVMCVCVYTCVCGVVSGDTWSLQRKESCPEGERSLSLCVSQEMDQERILLLPGQVWRPPASQACFLANTGGPASLCRWSPGGAVRDCFCLFLIWKCTLRGSVVHTVFL